jgi:hypothetical protein
VCYLSGLALSSFDYLIVYSVSSNDVCTKSIPWVNLWMITRIFINDDLSWSNESNQQDKIFEISSFIFVFRHCYQWILSVTIKYWIKIFSNEYISRYASIDRRKKTCILHVWKSSSYRLIMWLSIVWVHIRLTCRVLFVRLCLIELDLTSTSVKRFAHQRYDTFGEEQSRINIIHDDTDTNTTRPLIQTIDVINQIVQLYQSFNQYFSFRFANVWHVLLSFNMNQK